MNEKERYDDLLKRVEKSEGWLMELGKWLDNPAVLSQFSSFGTAGASLAFAQIRTDLHVAFPKLFEATNEG